MIIRGFLEFSRRDFQPFNCWSVLVSSSIMASACSIDGENAILAGILTKTCFESLLKPWGATIVTSAFGMAFLRSFDRAYAEQRASGSAL